MIGLIVNNDDTIEIVVPADGVSPQEALDGIGVTGFVVNEHSIPDAPIETLRYNRTQKKVYIDELANNKIKDKEKRDKDVKNAKKSGFFHTFTLEEADDYIDDVIGEATDLDELKTQTAILLKKMVPYILK